MKRSSPAADLHRILLFWKRRLPTASHSAVGAAGFPTPTDGCNFPPVVRKRARRGHGGREREKGFAESERRATISNKPAYDPARNGEAGLSRRERTVEIVQQNTVGRIYQIDRSNTRSISVPRDAAYKNSRAKRRPASPDRTHGSCHGGGNKFWRGRSAACMKCP